MKTSKESFELIRLGSEGSFSGKGMKQPDCTELLADLHELQRLESEPRARWEVITRDNKMGERWLVAHSDTVPTYASWSHLANAWIDVCGRLKTQPTHYLVNIPPVPKPATAPTADEWSAMVRAYVEEWREQGNSARNDDSTFGKLIALIERHNAASK